MINLPGEKIKTFGDIPSPRFRHTFTMVSPSKAVLFGGAVSVAGSSTFNPGKFVITNETFLYDFVTSKWKKISIKENSLVPS